MAYAPENERPARTNIATCRGDFALNNSQNCAGAWEDTSVGVWRLYVEQATVHRGPFGVKCTGPEGYQDGLSNTLAISELIVGDSVESRSVKGGISDQITNAQWDIPQKCLGVRDGKQLVGNILQEPKRGAFWCDGRTSYTGFCTSIQPNSPNCGGGNDGYFSAQSHHTGGVNVGLFDGSCSFVSDTIQCGGETIRLIMEPSNAYADSQSKQSPHGIWGAYGTRSGGEAVSLP